jgi:sialic acid synthase SpsE
MPLQPNRVYVIAEFGSNHFGALRAAEDAIAVAAEAGADSCKFQLFHLEDVLIDPSKGQRRTELPVTWIPKLAGLCREHHIDFLCTPFAPWAVEALNEYVWAWKIGSFEWKRADIWESCKATGKPIIASWGRGEPCGKEDYLLQCVSKYPAEESDIGFQEFSTERYDGLSDHSLSTVIPALAVARGAHIIEKHFRLDNTPTDSPDYAHSLTTDQLTEMVANIRLAEEVCRLKESVRIEYSNRRE